MVSFLPGNTSLRNQLNAPNAAVHEIDAAAEAVLWRAEANELALKQYVSSLARRKEHVAAAMAAGKHVLERVFVAAGTVADARARSRR